MCIEFPIESIVVSINNVIFHCNAEQIHVTSCALHKQNRWECTVSLCICHLLRWIRSNLHALIISTNSRVDNYYFGTQLNIPLWASNLIVGLNIKYDCGINRVPRTTIPSSTNNTGKFVLLKLHNLWQWAFIANMYLHLHFDEINFQD